MIVSAPPAESGHWYASDGSPAYTLVGKNGKSRNTTLRDARQLGLLPSVSTIVRQLAAPGLERWKRNQLLMSAMTMPRRDGENDRDYIARIFAEAEESSRAAADEGTRIHDAVERFYGGHTYPNEYVKHVLAVSSIVGPHAQAERSFASREGFGGRIDLLTNEFIFDVKTKDFAPGEKPTPYDEHLMQLCAYRIGMGEFRVANVFVSRSHPGAVHLHEWSDEDVERGTEMFRTLLRYWKVANKWQEHWEH